MPSENVNVALEVIRQKVDESETKTRSLKQAANAVAMSEGMDAPYPDANTEQTSTGSAAVRSDQFTKYGAPGVAARAFLEIRGERLGATTLDNIFDALKRGGYEFDGSDTDAKAGLKVALGKDERIKKLNNGSYGLYTWYGERPPKKDKADSGEATGATNTKDAGKEAATKAPAKA